MSGAQLPTQKTSAVVPATAEPTAATTTAAEANTDPVRPTDTAALSPDSRPEVKQGTDGNTATAANLTNIPKEEKLGKGEVLIESHAINEGVLNYKGPGLKGLIPSKKYFWLSDEPLEHAQLSGYLASEKLKDIAHPNAAHATQTGKGLMFGAKRAEDKHHPQSIFNLADVTDVAKGSFNDFTFSLHGQKHTFQATKKEERDGWLVTIESKAADAKTSREGIIGSSGYKSQLEKYGAPSAAGTPSTSRSLSRPKKASKSRERKSAGATSDTAADANTIAVADTTVENAPNSLADKTSGGTTGTTAGEAGAGAAAVGAASGDATARSGSTSDEDKSKSKKSRSQSRNKRGSLFGSLLGKKEEKENRAEDKAIKKDLKTEEKAEKKEDKAVKHEKKKEDKAERKEEKAEDKALKNEEKAEKKAEKHALNAERKEEKQLEKDAKHEGAGKTSNFDAAAIASRVVGEPVVPASGIPAGATGTAEPITAEPTAATGTTSASTATVNREATPKSNKRSSIFGSLFNKKDAAGPLTPETAPVVPAKDEHSRVSPTAPQLDSPVTSAVAAPAADAAETPANATATDSTLPATTTPTEKRRSSFFGTLGTKKGRSTGGTSDSELTDGEGKKQSSGGFGGLLRKASRAQGKGTSGSAAKEAADVPLPKDIPATSEATANGESTGGKTAPAEGEAGTNAILNSQEQTSVQAAA